IALGASLVGVGGPAIIAARSSADAVIEEMTLFLEELRVAMTLVGAANIAHLAAHTPILTGPVADWLRARDSR
ncbi:MAG: alpha-hydroxy-acid oxidizing protein, partial [Acidimicrobiales bacterium]